MTATAAARFAAAFAARGDGGRPGIIPYVTAGFPGPGDTAPLLLACQRAGSLAAEVGIPFSDPLADGPTIQSTGWRALEQGMTPARAIAAGLGAEPGEHARLGQFPANPDDTRGRVFFFRP